MSQLKQEVLSAIRFFIERQQLVAQAMIEMGLSLQEVGTYKVIAWSSRKDTDTSQLDALSASAGTDQERELWDVAQRAQRRQLSQQGFWHDQDHREWQYFLHGGGCQLTNLQSGEAIDWDCPNVLAFDPYFFTRHLEWQLTVPQRQSHLESIRQWLEHASIDSVLKEMQMEGLIEDDWTLPSS